MSRRVRCRVGDVVRCGRVVHLPGRVEPTVVARAVRGSPAPTDRVAVTNARPGPVHEYVGCIRPEMGLQTRTALAVAARSLGHETPHDPALTSAREALAALCSETTTTHESRAECRRVAASATDRTEQLREAVAAARGRLQARREQGLDPTPAVETLADAIERLSEAETSAVAARQRLDTVRKQTRDRRDTQRERFRLEDRVANLERQARACLREQVRDRYAAAVDAVPGVEAGGESFGAAPVAKALAVARVADLSAPVVLACDQFERPEAAADWLETPVIRL